MSLQLTCACSCACVPCTGTQNDACKGECANPTSDQVEAAKSKALLVNGSKELEGKSGLLSGARDLESLEEGQKLLKSLEGEAPASKQAI